LALAARRRRATIAPVSASAVPPQFASAHRQFLDLVADVRPELHRYCARMTGSIVDGEDVVQDTLAKALYMLGMLEEVPALRPWLFRVAHNAAIDFLRRRHNSPIDSVAEVPEAAEVEETVDAETVRLALAAFLALPPLQRSAVILKDVLGHSAAEIATALTTTVPAVKAALVRGRARLRQSPAAGPARDTARAPASTATLDTYVRLFNQGDWDAVRALLADDVRLDLVAITRRQGKTVGEYFTRYSSHSDLRLAVGTLEGRPVLWVFTPKASVAPAYFVEVETAGGRVTAIRDYRYAPYVVDDLPLTPRQL